MDASFNLGRFVTAQNPVYAQVCAELRHGHKTSHWMWFVFPQMAGLGRSDMSRQFAISSLDEAKAYLRHPVLGPRLKECAALVFQVSGKTVHEIFGSPDDLKFQSSMTLFANASPDNSIFEDNLKKYF